MDDRTAPGQEYGHDIVGDEPISVETLVPAPRAAGKPSVAVEQKSNAWLRLPLLGLGALALAGGALFWYLEGGRYESTEDAFLMAGQAAVAANVSGQVISIDVHENQAVLAGQILFRIDPRPFQTAVDEAQAQLAEARTQVQSRRHIWVEANFKESQLSHMRLGQPATVTVDAFADAPLRAHVASFSPGTGNSFSLLPAENATGNWVKVVQRLAVDLDFDQIPADMDLHAGLSASVSIDTGHVRHLFGPDTHADRPHAP